MTPHAPEEIWKVLEQQAREDEAFEAEMRAVAALSDDELDAELKKLGVDAGTVEASAIALRERVQREKAAGASAKDDPPSEPMALVAVAQDFPPQIVAEKPARAAWRRRPVVFWLAAGGAAAAAGGTYAALHHVSEPAPERPVAPSPVPEPVPSAAPSATPAPAPSPDLVAARDLRARAAAACHAGKPAECLSLLDDAKQADPAGDSAPDVTALRKQALSEIRKLEATPRPTAPAPRTLPK